MDQHPHNLVWIDLETTGLEPETSVILEIAVVITDAQLHLLQQGPVLVIHHPEEVLAGMDEWARRQHEGSGLLAEVRQSTLTLAQAEEMVLAAVSAFCPPRTCPLAGSSVCFDRLFLRKYMPRLNAHLHYRHVDVSSFKEMVKRWHPDKAVPNGTGAKHRALPDILDSIQELRYYREALFTPRQLS